MPVFNKVRNQARAVISMNNQKQIVNAANLFASDNNERYPQSVAYIEWSGSWNWSDPRTLAASNTTPSHPHRAMSEYLRDYIEDASLMFCPNAPSKFRYLQQAWDAGDQWNNPDTTFDIPEVRGTYCYYWNYTGWLNNKKLFRGPYGPSAGGKAQSKLLITCYFGYNHSRTPDSYGSCEKLKNANRIPETLRESAWWSCPASPLADLNVNLHAAYTDGHVENYTPAQAVPMKIIIDPITNAPYTADDKSPGDFYIPANSLR